MTNVVARQDPEAGAPVLPRSALILVGTVVVGGIAVLGSQIQALARWDGGDAAALTVLVAVVAVVERFQFEIRYRSEEATYSISDAIWTAGLLLVEPSVLVVSVGIGVLLGQSVQRWASVKMAFNVAQMVLGIAVAAVVFTALGAPGADQPVGWLVAALAMGAFQVFNTVAMALVISVVERQPFWRVALVTTGGVHWLGNVALGILVAVMRTTEPLALPLLLVPLVMTYVAYRGWLRSEQERDRMNGMARTADAISDSGDLSTRVTETGDHDEVGVLASTLNRMLDRLESAFRRERRFITETSHELRTPITICRGHLELLGPDATREEVQETVELVIDELDRMARIVQDMSSLARMEDPSSLRLEQVPLDRFLVDVAAKATQLLDGRLRMSTPPPASMVRADPQRLTQAVINLLHNAAEHTSGGAAVDLRVVRETTSWRFEVADEGDGLAPGEEVTVFSPFVTGRSSHGSGLGLAIVSGIARAHGGVAGVENRPGRGATFWLRVPR